MCIIRVVWCQTRCTSRWCLFIKVYHVFIDSLARELSINGAPVLMYDIQSHYILSADDLALVNLLVRDLQHNLNICTNHSNKWCHGHNSTKSVLYSEDKHVNKHGKYI